MAASAKAIAARKLATLKRVVRDQGVAGVGSIITNYTRRATRPIRWKLDDLYRTAKAGPDAMRARREFAPPSVLLAYFGGIGDDLLLTVVLREFRRRGYGGVWMVSRYPELFRFNDDPERVVPWCGDHERWIKAFRWDLLRPWYSHYVPVEDRDVSPPRHILSMMCEKAGIIGPVTLKPLLTLSDEERDAGALLPRQLVIQSSGLDARFSMLTKQWFVERYQEVVDTLRPDFNLIQIGSPKDPPLDGVLDLRGKTSLRETASIMSRSLAFIGSVGFPMHLARAVDCRSVIIYGGRELPSQSGYTCNVNLHAPVGCSPCWKLNTCEYDRLCMRQIDAADVVRGVYRQAARHGAPLEVDTDVIALDGKPMRTTTDGRTMLTIVDVFGKAREIEGKFLPEDAARFTRLPGRRVAAPNVGA